MMNMQGKKAFYKDRNEKFKKIALERIAILFDEAKEMYNFDPLLSNRYVFLARRIAMKCKVSIPKELKRRFCKNCNFYLVPGKNCRVRTNKSKIIYFCKNCKTLSRLPFVKEVKERRSKAHIRK